MMRQILNRVVVPLLFATVAVVFSIVAVERVSKDEERIAQFTYVPEPEKEEWIISCYDKIFQEVGAEYGVDWILLAAIASAESRFTADAVSRAGATGLMQVMPSVARSLGYTREQMLDPRTCVEVGAQILHRINDSFRFSQQFNKTERLHFILASYNAGFGRIADARRLARYHGASTGQWEIVSPYLKMLSDPEVVELAKEVPVGADSVKYEKVVKGGAFHGSAETIAYVKKVMRLYKRYKDKVAAAEKKAEK